MSKPLAIDLFCGLGWPEWTNYPHGSLDEWHARKLSAYCVWLEEQLLKAEPMQARATEEKK